MFCPKCGTQNADTMNFCAQCGSPLKQPVAEPVQESVVPVQKSLAPEAPVVQANEPVQQPQFTPEAEQPEPPAPKKKKKGLKIFLICLCALLVLAGTAAALIFTHVICLFHEFKSATCTAPKTCMYCEATEGEALGHDWSDATCTIAKFCYVCDEIDGDPLGHQWTDADCTTARTCSVCQTVDGEALGHTWMDATCTEAQYCYVCNAEGEAAKGHTMGPWETEQEPTLVKNGSKKRNCTVCQSCPETEPISAKSPKADGMDFNFTDSEFIDWLHTYSTVTAKLYEVDAETSMYEVKLQDGTAGLIFLDHDGTDSTGNIHMITVCFDNSSAGSALAIWIATKIDSSISSDAAIEALITGDYYIGSQLSITKMGDTPMFSLITNDYIDSL